MSRNMKDSGVEWIGEVPFEWGVVKIKHPLKERKENNKPRKTNNILSLLKDRGVIPYDEKGDIGNKSKENLEDYKLAYPGDIVLNSMNVIIGSVGLSKYFGAVSPVYYMLNTRYPEDSVQYLNYIFQTEEFQKSLIGYGNGILAHRMRIQMQKLNTAMIPYPKPETQQKIASFLDKKVAEIDHIINKTQASIEEYKCYKQSIITEAVTKGLDPNVPMKDSGVEWIGAIPEHWEVVKIKNLAGYKGGLFLDGDWIESDIITSEGVRYLTTGNIGEGYFKEQGDGFISEETLKKMNCLIVYPGDLVISRLNKPIGRACLLPDTHDKYVIAVDNVVLRPNPKLYNRLFLKFAMNIDGYFEEANMISRGATMPRISRTLLGNIKLPIPSSDEQQKIANFLDKKVAEIDNIISKKEQLINNLESYKKSLIYEVVTGKKEVM